MSEGDRPSPAVKRWDWPSWSEPVLLCLVVVLSFLLLVTTLVLGQPLWLPPIGRFLVVADPLQPADAVVVLGGGGPRRVAGGVELFREGLATWFVVTNNSVNMPGVRADYAELMRTEALWQGIPEESILVAKPLARTTYEEALALRDLLEQRGWTSLIVVTDAFHTRRAAWTFQDVFRGTGARIVVQPSSKSWYNPETWWQDDDSLRETWTEYLKLVLYVVGKR